MPPERLPRSVLGKRPSPFKLLHFERERETSSRYWNRERRQDLLDSVSFKHLNLTEHVTIENMIVEGSSCNVYMGSYLQCNGKRIKVAIKRTRVCDEKFRDGMQIWSKLDHPNILTFVGYTLKGQGPPLLISEWMENGTVDKYVESHPYCDIHQIVTGIAEGLTYLHSKEIIHGNIKAVNVLVSGSGQPQICSFGISHLSSCPGSFVEPTSPMYFQEMSLMWMAPEALGADDTANETSERTDVWAFGMTIYELLTGAMPYSHLKIQANVIFSLIKRELPPAPKDLLEPKRQLLWSICEYCWLLPEVRPAMTMICHSLRPNAEEVQRVLQSASVTLNLRRTLQDFQHFDLSDKITQVENYSRDHGASSDVYFGQSLEHNKGVAIKRVRYWLHNDLTFLKRMVRELQIWVRLTDKNILPLLGYTTDSEMNTLSLITEWMSNRTVMHYMKSNKENSSKVLHMAKGIASGLAYLHSKGVVHSDLKSGNVLVSSEGEPLLTDFGISHILLSSNSIMPLTTGMHGTVRWMAYEQMRLENGQTSTPYTVKTDVWSFGMTVLELLTLEVPYVHLGMDHLVPIAIYKGELPPQPKGYNSEWSEERKRLWAICESCWNLDPNARPSVDAIKHELDGI